MADKPDYKSTMNLPQTEFPMKANLSQREPQWLEFWDRADVYRRSLEQAEGEPWFELHDGPPYANGDIHMGTAFNKVFKDLVVKYKSMRGFYAPYVPGWDCHGQPIEHQVEKTLGPDKMRETSQAEVRRLSREYAMRFVERQAEEFRRLGVRGEFDDPYLTLHPSYEAGDVKVFAEMYRRGMVYKGSKPIHWCYRCKTALAEAEIEYGDEESDSIYVAFPLAAKPKPWVEVEVPLSILIWTTTPWTLPANVAVTLADGADYVAVRVDGQSYVLAEELVGQVAETVGWSGHEVLPGRAKGAELSGAMYLHPIHEGKDGVIITGEHVDLTTGTGAVHTAPGHGEEDWLVGQRFGLPSPMPVDDLGVFDEGGGPFAGLHVDDANPRILEFLRDAGTLVWSGKTMHSYPHCWRCKKPVIFRATEQWFVSMDRTGLRDAALRAIDDVEWIPGWSVNRISSMVADRPDWCISRQRAWGVPIPVFECVACGETVASDESFAAVERLFATEGADAWFTKDPSEYLPADVTCERCGGGELRPEYDILDVWFESGASHTSVLQARDDQRFPAELYLEGSDQHRGWFQSALLTSVGAYDVPPFKAVLTHGFIVDGEGRKMSKSLGNVIDPLDVVERFGADIVRLWAASADYSQDVSVSDEILDRTAEAYRRIRNTFRFLLSNLYDYEPEMAVAWSDMPEIDRYAAATLAELSSAVTRFYDEWQFHRVYREVYEYCVTALSAFYLDALKDRLYSDAADSLSRRSAQTVLASALTTLVRLVAPILTFTAEEVWHFMPEGLRTVDSVQLAGWPELAVPAGEAAKLREAYDVVLRVRDAVTKALEEARNAKVVGKSQEAKVVIVGNTALAESLRDRGERHLADLFIVSAVELRVSEAAEEVEVEVIPADGSKCPRCWNFRSDVGGDPAEPELCARCADVVRAL